MARYVFKLPDVGEGMAEAEIGDWHIEVGSVVEEDQPLVDMTTDKATVEITSPVRGTILELYGAKGDKRPIGSELVVLEVAEASAAVAVRPASDTKTTSSSPAVPPAAPTVMQVAPPVGRTDRSPPPGFSTRPSGEAPQASPAVRRKAWTVGVELQFIAGSGPGGRITMEDLDAYVASKGSSGVAERTSGSGRRDGGEDVQVIGLRRTIAERMQDTKRRIPHFSYVEEIDVTTLEDLRKFLNAKHGDSRAKLNFLPFLIRALCVVLPEFPQINATFDDVAGTVRRHRPVHAGIATQTPGGLVVTVVSHAEALSLWECADAIARLAALARAGKAGRAELSGSTITITSLGPMGGVATTPIINQPEVAIIGVNKMIERPVIRNGQVAIRTMMNLSSSFDHRVVDGWDAAAFIQRLKQHLEQPATLFMDPS